MYEKRKIKKEEKAGCELKTESGTKLETVTVNLP